MCSGQYFCSLKLDPLDMPCVEPTKPLIGYSLLLLHGRFPGPNSDEAQEATCESKAVGETFQDISSDARGLPAVANPYQLRLEAATGQEQATSQNAAVTKASKENSPEQSSRCRQIYQGFIVGLALQAYEEASKETANKALSLGYAAQSVHRIQNPLMIENLSIAASNAMYQDEILRKVFEEIENVTYGNVEEQEEGLVEESDAEGDVDNDEPVEPHGQVKLLNGDAIGSGGEGPGNLSADIGNKVSEEEDTPAAPEDEGQNPEVLRSGRLQLWRCCPSTGGWRIG